MLLPLAGRRFYYDLVGPEDGPVVCITHSLASDGGMWAEQMPPLLQAGFRVLRVIAGLLLYAVLYNAHTIIAGAPVVIP